MAIQLVEADLNNPSHAADIVRLIDDYASDDIGGGGGLPADSKARLVQGLRDFPTTLVLLAFEDGVAVGIAVCFQGFSTFAARRLINIHDLAVVSRARGRGIGGLLMEAVETRARELGCCKVTLEVLERNARGKALYLKRGYHQLVYRPEDGGAEFWAKAL
jgi:GNAT superfamily N-acetyltransferase